MRKFIFLSLLIALCSLNVSAATLATRLLFSSYVVPPPTTLNLDFTTGVNPSGYTFTNSSGSRSYYDVAGTLVFTGANIPRLDYDPTTHAGSWLLYENSATNLTRSSIPNNLDWSISSGVPTITANAATSPDGTANSTLIQENTASTFHYTSNSGVPVTAFTSGLSYTNSVYVKSGTASVVQLLFTGGIFGSNAYCNFNLSTVAVGSCGAAGTNAFITDVGNGWYRIGVTSTATSSSSNTSFFIAFTNNNASAGRLPVYVGTSSTLYVYGAQTEQASSASSYIPTSASTVTRDADLATFWMPVGMSTITYTFDDNTTQQETGVTGGAFHSVPYTLNRKRIKYIVGS